MFATTKKQAELLLAQNKIFRNDLSDDLVIENLKKIRICCVNTLNVYSKVIGLEVTSLYENAGILIAKRFKNNTLGYVINKGVTSLKSCLIYLFKNAF